MATYKQSDKLKAIGEKVIKANKRFAHLDTPECRIAYQYSSDAKTSRDRIVYADTEVVKEKLKGLVPYDFIMTFYEPNCQPLSAEKMERLMYHELCHVGFKGLGKYSIIPHDVEDFRVVIEAWGLDWIK